MKVFTRIKYLVLVAFTAFSFSSAYVGNAYSGDINQFFKDFNSNLEEKAQELAPRPKEREACYQYRQENYEDEVEGIVAKSAVEALEKTHLGQEIKELEERVKRYSKISFVGNRERMGIYTDQKEKPELEDISGDPYELDLGIYFDRYKPFPGAELAFGELEFKLGYKPGEGIDSGVSYGFEF